METLTNKETVQKYMTSFARLDHEEVLSCLTDDVEWYIPGAFNIAGKPAFDKEIENDTFTGRPDIKVTRLTEENDIVVAEGTVRATRRDGTAMDLAYCDVFEMRGGLIKRLISYLVEIRS